MRMFYHIYTLFCSELFHYMFVYEVDRKDADLTNHRHTYVIDFC